MNKDHASARAEFKLAIQLNPNDAQYYILLAFSQVHAGFAEEALENFRVALTLSPRDPRFGWFHTGMGAAHFYLRHYDECLEWGRKGLQYPIVQCRR